MFNYAKEVLNFLDYAELFIMLTTVESRYLEYSISRTLDLSNKTIRPILINLHQMTSR